MISCTVLKYYYYWDGKHSKQRLKAKGQMFNISDQRVMKNYDISKRADHSNGMKGCFNI